MKTSNSYAQKLYSLLSREFSRFSDSRKTFEIPIQDAVMSALGMFSLKSPSLLKFDSRFRTEWGYKTLKNLFGITTVPSDTQMRTIVDEIPSSFFHSSFKLLVEFVRKRKKLKKFIFLSSQKINKRPLYLMPVDATGFFSSSKIECPSCMVKSKGTEKERYYHQFLGATIVHPDLKTVLPVGTEPIDNRFARKAQDCEISAFKRLIVRIKNLYPKLGLVVSGDGLYACGTVIDLVEKCEMGYIFSAKESRVPLPIKYHRWSKERGLAMEREYVTEEGVKVLKKVTHKFSYQNGVSLNNSHDKIKTNILEYREITEWDLKGKEKRKEKKFCWITNITLNERNIWKVMRGGRSRWKIENETFNTLKNQGYNIEHNYGHGKKNLGSNFATLAFLAFAVDQIQEMNCDLFKEALKKCGGYRNGLWDVMRVIHHFFIIESWDFLFLRIITGPIGGCRDGPD